MHLLTKRETKHVGGGVAAVYWVVKGAWAAGKAAAGAGRAVAKYAARNKITTAAAVGAGVGYSTEREPKDGE